MFVVASCHRRDKTPVEPPVDTVVPADTIVVDTIPDATTTPKKENKALPIQWLEAPRHDKKSKTPEVIYTPEQLHGHWVSSTLHEVYLNDGTGISWDTDDDVRPEEGQRFVWTLENNCLVARYPISMGGEVPNISYVMTVDSVHMIRRDDYGNTYRLRRAPMELNIEYKN